MRTVAQYHPLPGPNMSPVAITSVYPIQITTTSLPDATHGISYSASFAAIGGVSPYAWTIIGGALPPGLSMDSNGNITGTPIATGVYFFEVQVTDIIGNKAVLNVGVAL